jgi:hypothetical protein
MFANLFEDKSFFYAVAGTCLSPGRQVISWNTCQGGKGVCVFFYAMTKKRVT